MKKLGKFILFGLLIFLSVALVFVGGNFLEGQKDKKPGVEWCVTIPLKGSVSPWGSVYNLYGTNGGVYFDDSTHVFAGGNKGLRKHPDYPYHVFELTLCNTKSWGDSCMEEDEYYIPGDYTVGFQDIILNSKIERPDQGSICFFPPMTDITGEPDHPSCYGISEPPSCMECFLNNTLHPSSWACVWCEEDQRYENRGYMGAYIKIKVFDEIWNYPMGVPIKTEMSLYISVYTGRLTHWGEDIYHDIEIHIPRGNTYMADVTRLEKGWNIVFDPLPQENLVEFRETYKELLGEVKSKAKSGQSHYEYEKHTTMIATADHFSFEISWERY